jgi:asparagine synthase (glutamine-hydrolysing)
MGSVAGWVTFRHPQPEQAKVVIAMANTMSRRDPCDHAAWMDTPGAVLACRKPRSAKAPGAQPAVVTVGDMNVALVCDGVVYDRSAVGRGEDDEQSIAQGLLESYLREGGDFLARADGAFAIAIWDGRTRELILARDHFGLKPLYYFEHEGGIVFASEPKAILAHPSFEPCLDPASTAILLQPRLKMPGETPLVGLREVPPAHALYRRARGSELRRYWELASRPHEDSFEVTAETVQSLIEESVRKRVPADGACATMLSGGIDSTTVTALAAKALGGAAESDLFSFCLRFRGEETQFSRTELRPGIDGPYARLAADFIGSRHRAVTVDTGDLDRVVPTTRKARDLPGWRQFDASMYLILTSMRRVASVGLSGEAADEFFGGYPYLWDRDLIRRETFPWLGNGPKLSEHLSADLLSRFDPAEDERSRYSQALAEVPALPGEASEEARMREALHLGMQGPLAMLLEREDRMSMCHGLEVRLPFCEYRLVEYVWNVPWSMKSHTGLKGLLKHAVRDFVPSSTLNRQKSAYPNVQDPEHDLQLIAAARSAVNDPESSIAWMFDTKSFNALLDRIGSSNLASLPGGVRAPQLLVQLVELRDWIDDYEVAFR